VNGPTSLRIGLLSAAMVVTNGLLVVSVATLTASPVGGQSVRGPETVVVASAGIRLRAFLWRPPGSGPFPAVLFNIGDVVGQPDTLGQLFARRGYVFLYLFRRGTGLSVGQGADTRDLLAREQATAGVEARDRLYVKLLETDHLADGLAALAFLRALPEVDSRRVAAAGHSGGGSLALLLAERDSALRAAVDFAGAARNWERSPWLRERLLAAARQGTAPVLIVHAANDVSLAPAAALAAEMARRGRQHRVRIYPAFGRTSDEGHRFVYLSATTWEDDVFAFLDEHMRRQERHFRTPEGPSRLQEPLNTNCQTPKKAINLTVACGSRRLLRSDPEMRVDGLAQAHTDEGTISYENAGLAVWTAYSGDGGDGNHAWFDLQNGCIVVKNPDIEILRKMSRVAAHFEARVQGDEGEDYGPNGEPIEG